MSTESEVAVGSADDRGSSPRLCAKLAPDQSAIASRLRQLQHRYVFSASQLRSLVTELNDLQANRNDWTMETYDRVEEILFEVCFDYLFMVFALKYLNSLGLQSRQLFHDMELIHRQQVSDPSVSFGHALHDEFVKLKSIIDATVQELLMELIRQGLQRPSQSIFFNTATVFCRYFLMFSSTSSFRSREIRQEAVIVCVYYCTLATFTSQTPKFTSKINTR
jgi:hypothetical protein